MNENSNKLNTTAVIVLLVVAAVLGYVIYTQLSGTGSPGSGAQEAVGEEENAVSGAEREGNEPVEMTEEARLLRGDLTAEERSVLTPPSSNATEAELRSYAELVSRYAQPFEPGGEVVIRQCNASPLVARVPEGAVLEFANRDNVAHEIVFNPQNRISIPAGGSASVTASFAQGPGLYAYACDAKQSPIGILLISTE